jgi:hypothetical protein
MTAKRIIRDSQEDPAVEEAKARRSARQLWFRHLKKMVDMLGWTTYSSEAYIAWSSEPGEPGTEHDLTAEQVDKAITSLQSIRKILFAEGRASKPRRGT